MPVFRGKGRKPNSIELVVRPGGVSGWKRKKLLKRYSRRRKSKPKGFEAEIEQAVNDALVGLSEHTDWFFVQRNGMQLKSNAGIEKARRLFARSLDESLRELFKKAPLSERPLLLRQAHFFMKNLKVTSFKSYTLVEGKLVEAGEHDPVAEWRDKIVRQIIEEEMSKAATKCAEYASQLPKHFRKASGLSQK